MRAKLNVEFEYLRDVFFDHRYFAITDSNNVTLAYSNDYVPGARVNDDFVLDLYPNTLTVYSPYNYGVNKYEFPDVTMKDLDFHCGVPSSTRGTLMCDLDLEFVAQSKLMNGDLQVRINDSIPITYHALDEITLAIDPASGEILLDFNEYRYGDDNYYDHHHANDRYCVNGHCY